MTFKVALDTDAGVTKSILNGIEVVEDLNCLRLRPTNPEFSTILALDRG